MLGIGAGGLDVALAMAGFPYHVPCPRVLGVKLTGTLCDWVSAKDVILEMLRRQGGKGCVGKIVEYYGPGVKSLSATDRETIPASLVLCTVANDIGYIYVDMKHNFVSRSTAGKYRRVFMDTDSNPATPFQRWKGIAETAPGCQRTMGEPKPLSHRELVACLRASLLCHPERSEGSGHTQTVEYLA